MVRAGFHCDASESSSLRARFDSFAGWTSALRTSSREQSHAELVRYLFKRRRRNMEQTEGTSRIADRRPAHREARPRWTALHFLSRQDARQPNARRLGRVGWNLRRYREWRRGAISSSPQGQHEISRLRLSGSRDSSRWHVRHDDVRTLGQGRVAVHLVGASEAVGARRTRESPVRECG